MKLSIASRQSSPIEAEVNNLTSETLDSSLPIESNNLTSSLSQTNQRFPPFGTPEFEQKCSWIENKNIGASRGDEPNCYMLSRPRPSSTEGISEWLTEIALGKIYSVQLGCQHILDYGPGIDIHSVITYADADNDSKHSVSNWTVPDGFEFNADVRATRPCFWVSSGWNDKMLSYASNRIAQSRKVTKGQDKDVRRPPPKAVFIPNYRFMYHSDRWYHEQAKAALPAINEASKNKKSSLFGFDFESGMACALQSTFQPSQMAADYVPTLYSELMPALSYDKGALVIALYIRPGRTDEMVRGVDGKVDALLSKRERFVRCALEIEKDYLAKGQYSRSNWFIASDSPKIRESIIEQYDSKTVTAAAQDGVVERRIYTTESRGIHTKAMIQPDSAHFAEAFLDWFLLGESDVILCEKSYTFAHTAALRTARPIIVPEGRQCRELEFHG